MSIRARMALIFAAAAAAVLLASAALYRTVAEMLLLQQQSELSYNELTLHVTLSSDINRYMREAAEVSSGGGSRMELAGLAGIVTRDLAVIEALESARNTAELSERAEETQDEREGHVSVAAAEADGELTLSVADNGEGIAGDNLARIFEPLFSTKLKGTGLGLAISAGIVRRHGGTIGVKSNPGEGTPFIIRVPGTAKAKTQAPVPA